MLDVCNLSISFPNDNGAAVPVVRDVSFHVGSGEVVGLVGKSGCGKTVLATSVLGMLEPPGQIDSGTIRYQKKNGTAVDLLSLGERAWQRIRGKEISMIFQDSVQSLNPSRTIGSQFAEALRVHRKGLSRAECTNITGQMLESVMLSDIDHVMGAYPFQLSGGMCQRVMIAMVLAHRPRLLIADEPTTALDVVSQAQIISLMQKLQREYGTAILLISHDLKLVQEIAGHVVKLG
ncbi:ABC transporter ATP-binding protein [Christensenellaceae bacterium OttesenSCG-928-K19]|nr:ABC transporter ATP-binding protein [Christensenellaceae bacterium OttesenSCG-928-K19]